MELQLLLHIFGGFAIAFFESIEDSISIDGDLNDPEDSRTWHRVSFATLLIFAFMLLLTRLLSGIEELPIAQDAMMMLVFGTSFWVLFDPLLNFQRDVKDFLNHLGKNPIDRALAWLSKITRISPFIIRLIIFASTITLTVLI